MVGTYFFPKTHVSIEHTFNDDGAPYDFSSEFYALVGAQKTSTSTFEHFKVTDASLFQRRAMNLIGDVQTERKVRTF